MNQLTLPSTRLPIYERMKEYAVTDVSTLEDFLLKYYKYDRLGARGKDYARAIVADAKDELAQYGYVLISQFESITGQAVTWYRVETSAN